MRKTKTFEIGNPEHFKQLLLSWSQQFNEVVWLDSNQHQNKFSAFDGLLAADGLTALSTDALNAFEKLKEYQMQTQDWIFGYLAYDLKNDIEPLVSKNFDGLEFPELYFFQPKKIIQVIGNQVHFRYLNMVADEIAVDFSEISALTTGNEKEVVVDKKLHVRMRIFKDEYFRQVQKMLHYIRKGAIYEANFCQEFYVEDCVINPITIYKKLNEISKAPFATYMKFFDKYLLCASPERYLKKNGTKLVSQPIKGTAPRSANKQTDVLLKNELETNQKERSENIMIVDLVRNDLSKSALKSSVRVEELCKVYSFDQVHQMISTISSKVSADANAVDLLKDTFPMGSMTGAPKISAMQIIEELEAFKRGLYSGAVGYFTPDADFDFNVVIRSILYNERNKYLSYAVGSAITEKAIPAKEYEECLLKAKAMRQVLEE